MTRVQWLEIQKLTRSNLTRMAESMLSNKYEEARGWGYQISEVRKDFVKGKLIERRTRAEEITNPFGETRKYEFVTYAEVGFYIQTGFPQLQIEDPPRSVGPFVSAIGECLNHEVFVREIFIKQSDWVSFFHRSYKDCSMVKATIKDLALSKDASALFILIGEKDVESFSEELTRGRKHRLACVQINFVDKEELVKFEVNETCKLKILYGEESHSEDFFREAISKIVRELPDYP